MRWISNPRIREPNYQYYHSNAERGNGGCYVPLVHHLDDTKMEIPTPIAKITYRRRVVAAAGTVAVRGEYPSQEIAQAKICER